MEFKLTSITESESKDYLKIIYNEKEYMLDQFAKSFQNCEDEFYLDKMLKECVIKYKDKEFTYQELCKNINEFSSSLLISDNYRSKIYEVEKIHIFMIDKDYYAAGKLIESAEKQLMYGRQALIQAYSVLDFNVNCNWISGYVGLFFMRTIKINNAIMWYNNVFDSIMQIIFIAFGIYKKHPNYREGLEYHKILGLCNYSFLSGFYGKNKTIPNFKELWKIIAKAQIGNSNVNQWANYIKHKGGINFKGVEAKSPLNARTENKDGTIINDTDFESPEIDIDDVINELAKVHVIQVKVIQELTQFISFESAKWIYKDGKLIKPKESSYKKLIIE